MPHNNNFQLHSKSQKPVEFKKIQNLQVKAGGQAAVTSNLTSQKNLIKINYDDLKKVLQRDQAGNIVQPGQHTSVGLPHQMNQRKSKNQIQIQNPQG